MPNDARLGMVVGVALVIASAIFFVRKDAGSAPRPLQAAAAPSPTRPDEDKSDEATSITVAAPKKKPRKAQNP